jgi:phage host-nuclease inhibitor protein Gam
MADVDYATDIKKYSSSVEQKAIDGIVRFLGIALKSRDSSYVACSSNDELARVRESFLKRKLKMSDDDAALDQRIQAVCEQMKDDSSKHRVTFYYLLAEKAGKLGDL